MNYREESKMVYEQSLRAYGATEMMIKIALAGFDTGYSVGIASGNEREEQVDMLKGLLNGEVVN